MPKKKTDKVADKGAEQAQLTEWQKRNLEFQERKRERQEAKEREEALLRQEKLAQLKAQLNLPKEGPAATPKGVKPLPVSPKSEEKQVTKKRVKGNPKFKVKQPVAKEQRPTKPGLPKPYRKALYVAVPALVVLLISFFLVSPFSKTKHFVVSGAKNTTQDQVVAATGIKDSDYVPSLIGGLGAYEKAVVANNPWVKSAKMAYDFPNTFRIAVEEHPIVAYNLTDKGYRPVLANGAQVDDVRDNQLPEGFLPLDFEKESDRRTFIKQLMTLEPELRLSILEVAFAGSESTKDLLLLTMVDGHTVRVPLSEMALKLPYYQSIKKKLAYPAIIDMEVGIYTTSPELETRASETKASREQERREAQAISQAAGAGSTTAAASETATEAETSLSSQDE